MKKQLKQEILRKLLKSFILVILITKRNGKEIKVINVIPQSKRDQYYHLLYVFGNFFSIICYLSGYLMYRLYFLNTFPGNVVKVRLELHFFCGSFFIQNYRISIKKIQFFEKPALRKICLNTGKFGQVKPAFWHFLRIVA